jgi:PKD repeat protein
MAFTTPTTPIFESYTPSPNSSGGVDGRFVKPNSQIAADAGSHYDGLNGKITIIVKASDLTLAPATTISGFVSGVSQSTDAAHIGAGATFLYDQMPDSLAFAGSYTVNSNQVCRPNTPPTAVLNATPTSGFARLTVTFDGSGSSDPDTAPPADTIASYTFNFGDGNSATTQAPTATTQHQYANPGTYTASLTVTDSRGASSTNSATKTITVNGQPDLIVSSLKASNNQAPQGSKVTLTATIKNQGTANAVASQTEFLLDNSTRIGLVNTAALAPGASVQVSVDWYTASVKKGQHTIKATADKNNAVAESNENNNTATVTVSIQGNKT